MTSPGVPSLLYGEEYGLASDVVELLPENVWDDRACLTWGEGTRNKHLRELVTSLCAVRTKSAALKEGSVEVVYAEGGLLVFRRSVAGEVIDVALNASDAPVDMELEDDQWDGLEPWIRVGAVQVQGQRVVLGANAGLVAKRSISASKMGPRRMQIEANRRCLIEASRQSMIGAKGRPVHLDFSLTEMCNLRCAHCINESPMHTRMGSARTMSSALIERLQDDFSYASYFGFVHGGESLAARHTLFAMLEAIKRAKAGAPYTVHLLSNGMLLSEAVVARLSELGVNSLSVSLDGATSEVNDSIRRGGRFDRILANLKGAVKFRKERGVDIRIGVSQVLMRDNLQQAEQMVDLCGELGVDWLKLEELVARGDFAKEQMVEREQAVKDAVERVELRAKGTSLRVVDHTRQVVPYACLVKNDAWLGEHLRGDEFANRSEIDPCRAQWEQACIDPNGDVRIGDFYNLVIGNVMEKSLEEIWGGMEARAQRERWIEGRPCGTGGAACP
jgi:MoaA/NifB/PqqE/SkfB family radical SAM enzyme